MFYKSVPNLVKQDSKHHYIHTLITNSMNTSHNYVKLFFFFKCRQYPQELRIPFSSRPKTLDVQPTFEHSLVRLLHDTRYLLGITEVEHFQRWPLPAVPFRFPFSYFCSSLSYIHFSLVSYCLYNKACLDIPFFLYRKCISRNHINLIIFGRP